jgi:hypothetical protein
VFPLKNMEKLLHESSVASNKFVDDVQILRRISKLRRSKRARKERNFGNNFIAYIVDDDSTCYCEAIKSI